MMLFYTFRIRLLLVWCLPMIFAPTNGDVLVGSMFRSIPRGIAGSCMDYDFDITTREIEHLLDKAIWVLNQLSQPVPFDELWVRRLNMAAAMFGIEYARKADYNYARDSLLDARRDDSRWKVECGDADLKWATTLGDLGYTKKKSTTPDPTSLVDTVAKYRNRGAIDIRILPGLFFSKYWSPQKDGHYEYKKALYLKSEGSEGQNPTRARFCATAGHPAAVTLWSSEWNSMLAKNLIVFCGPFLRALNLLQAKQTQMSVCDMDDAMTRAGIVLHELMHISSHLLAREPPNIDDQDIIVNGQTEKVYYFQNCVDLAQMSSSRALRNADNFRLFAEGVFLDERDWWPEGNKYWQTSR
ncbi:uncharacterized protein N7459_000162 [Penicillium hispanicum]|uniref:uncharacterized protein n=1 Tax=Penicillium hispanicum TaxID=1080232 RepID=UPI00253FCB40|nr:uncharacterized protein N7459_000162 [Penicillium hispanicum]KAJ5593954.1 hypothetical protein N7459_000162 [Penicillium hispanicum]